MPESEPTKLSNIHPGEILREDYLEYLDLSPYRLAKELNIPQTRISAILHGERGITADTAMRLAQYFRTSPQFWMRLQDGYELEKVRRTKGAEIERIKPLDQQGRKDEN